MRKIRQQATLWPIRWKRDDTRNGRQCNSQCRTFCQHSKEVCVQGDPKHLLTYLLTYLPTHTTWTSILPAKLTGFQLPKKFPAFYGTRRFITAVTSARHLSLSWARSISLCPPPSHFLKFHLHITLPSMPGSSKWFLVRRFLHQNPVYTSPLPPSCYMPR